jgi:hypothetical protein
MNKKNLSELAVTLYRHNNNYPLMLQWNTMFLIFLTPYFVIVFCSCEHGDESLGFIECWEVLE